MYSPNTLMKRTKKYASGPLAAMMLASGVLNTAFQNGTNPLGNGSGRLDSGASSTRGWNTLRRPARFRMMSHMAEKTPTVIPATTNAATNDEVVEALVSAPVADMMGDRYDAAMSERVGMRVVLESSGWRG